MGSVITYYVWDEEKLLAEYDGTGARKFRYAYLPDGASPSQVQDANGIYDVHNDLLTTGRFLTNSAQRVVWTGKASAYGLVQADEDADGNGIPIIFNLRFPGLYYDQEKRSAL